MCCGAPVIKKVNKVILTYRTYHECASNHSPTSLHMPAHPPTLPSYSFFPYSRSIDDWIGPNIRMLHSVVGVLCNAKLMSGKMSYPTRLRRGGVFLGGWVIYYATHCMINWFVRHNTTFNSWLVLVRVNFLRELANLQTYGFQCKSNDDDWDEEKEEYE